MSKAKRKQHYAAVPLDIKRRRESDPVTDWSLCFICQEEKQEKLIYPLKNNDVTARGAAYKSVAVDLKKFSDADALPCSVRVNCNQEPDALKEVLSANQAAFHKSCRHKFHPSKLERHLQRRMSLSAVANEDTADERRSTRSTYDVSIISQTCFFCDKSHPQLVEVRTLGLSERVNQAAATLQDQKILAKLSNGDMVATEAKYHKQCLASFYQKARKVEGQEGTPPDKECGEHFKLLYGVALGDLIDFITESLQTSQITTPVFKLNEAYQFMIARLEELGVDNPPCLVHRTRLKEHILDNIVELNEHKCGRDILLTLEKAAGHALSAAVESNSEDDGRTLAKAARIIRRDLLEHDIEPFNGDFSDNMYINSVPPSLLTLIKMILSGPLPLQTEEPHQVKTAAMTISQLIVFNSAKRRRKTTSRDCSYSRKSRETPLPLYLLMMIYSKTRKKGLIKRLSALGLSVSYNRVQEISETVCQRVCASFEKNGIVCPTSTLKNEFTTAAIDNIDHNPSSLMSAESFHGTSISLIQHCDKRSIEDVSSAAIEELSDKSSRSLRLPDSYVSISSAKIVKSSPHLSSLNNSLDKDIQLSLKPEFSWLSAVSSSVNSSDTADKEIVTWAAYHSRSSDATKQHKCKALLLPLLKEPVQSPAMVRHSFDLIFNCMKIANPNQTPVITADQPVYALAKQLQWSYPQKYGEDKLFVMMGGLHIEMCILKMIGTWLEGSGWLELMVESGATSRGKAEAALSGSHVKRARYAHQVSLAAFFILLEEAWRDSGSSEALQTWASLRADESVNFKYWLLTLELQSLLLSFVRSIRSADYNLYVDSIRTICPWLFALNRGNYARWMPVFLHSLDELEFRHPNIYHAFLGGYFVARKTDRNYSCMSDDQIHEQNNKLVKMDGGAIGLFDQERALIKWMLGGPELSRMTSEYEEISRIHSMPDIGVTKHNEDSRSFEEKFLADVVSLADCIRMKGNPFEFERESRLMTLHSKRVLSEEAASSVYEASNVGKTKFKEFCHDRLQLCKLSLHETIKKSNLTLFRDQPTSKMSKGKQKLAELRHDCHLFSRLFIACQSRAGNLSEFFSHENQAYPPSLAEFGALRCSNKSEVLPILEAMMTPFVEEPDVTAIVIDGPALIHALPPGASKTFEDYVDNIIIPYLFKLLGNVSRVDIIFDRYLEQTLKGTTRQKRGTGTRVHVTASTPVPTGKWSNFLMVDENKTELFLFIVKKLSQTVTPEDKLIISSASEKVFATRVNVDLETISPCTHEEADTRLLLHTLHAKLSGHQDILIKTVDTDVVILAVGAYFKLDVQYLWLDFGQGKHKRFLAIHEIAWSLKPDVCDALPFWHAFTGCDTVSSFYGRGKKTAWGAWSSFPQITTTFIALSHTPEEDAINEHLPQLERFVIHMYDKTSSLSKINDCRQDLFTKKNRSIENIPPTEGALRQHVKRAVLQAGYIWRQCLTKAPAIPTADNWGWALSDGVMQPLWSLLPDVAKTSQALIKCACKRRCSANCKCVKAALPCTHLCICDGQCSRDY